MVLACIAAPTGVFEPYEINFLANILPQLRLGRQVSDKQFAWLGRLYEVASAAAGPKP